MGDFQGDNLMATRLNIRIDQGASFELSFYVYQSGTTSTIVGDLTGFTVSASARSSAEASSASFTFTGTVTTPASELCKISLTPTETAAITTGVYWFDVEVSSGTTIYRPIEGVAYVDRGMTR